MTPDCTGQHAPPCADCAIMRVRTRPPVLKAGYAAAIAATGNAWRFLGDFIAMDGQRHAYRSKWLRGRWRALPPPVQASNLDVAEAFADDLVVIERLLVHLEGEGWRSAA